MAQQARSEGAGQHTGGRDMHACNQPLGDGKQPGDFGEAKVLSKRNTRRHHRCWERWTENEARKRPPIGRVCRGRNDVLAHGDGCLGNLVHSEHKPGPGCVSIKGSQLAAALQCNWATRMSQKAASAGG